MMALEPATIYKRETGATHGSGYSYDTHVPIVFLGKEIKAGRSRGYVEIIDIVPTVSNLLKIQFPNSSTGKVLHSALK